MRRFLFPLFAGTILLVGGNGFAQEPAKPADPPSPEIVYQAKDLNPAFILSPENYIKAIQRGQDLAKKGKPAGDVYKSVEQQPRGVKGEKGKSHESSVVCFALSGVGLSFEAYNAANRYEPFNIPDEKRKNGTFAKKINFGVSLNSVPKVANNIFQNERRASEADVRVIKFVLTDDQGHIFNASETTPITGIKSGTMDFSGVTAIPQVERSNSSVTGQANVSGSDGYASASGSAYGTSTYYSTKYIPWSEQHPYYSAVYRVSFPLFDEKGNPLITTATKSITLHIITPNGEKAVDYELKPPKL